MTNEEFINQNAASYSNEYSKFPYKRIAIHHFKDADDSIASLLNEIDDLKARGLYSLAEKKIKENADILREYTYGSELINTVQEEIHNTQTMALQKHQCVYTDNKEPEVCCVGDIWIS